MDSRLSRWVDDDGQLWQLCQICTDPTRYENLAVDPQDPLIRWDVCAACRNKETE